MQAASQQVISNVNVVGRRPKITKPVYYFTKVVLFVTFTLWFRIRVENAKALPKRGGVIVAPTHRSYLDIPTLGVGMRRPPTFMASSDLFKTRLSAAFFRMYGSFPVTIATPDHQAIKTCIDLLKAGDAVTVFPEGGIRSGDRVKEVFSGVAFMALKADCPIIPVAMAGTEAALARGMRWPRPRKIVIRFGAPIEVSTYKSMERREAIDALTLELHDRLQQVFDTANERRG